MMNLFELDALINSLDPSETELLNFYQGKRKELLAQINANIIKELARI